MINPTSISTTNVVFMYDQSAVLAIANIDADRLKETGTIPSLAALIRELSASNPFGWSWQPES